MVLFLFLLITEFALLSYLMLPGFMNSIKLLAACFFEEVPLVMLGSRMLSLQSVKLDFPAGKKLLFPYWRVEDFGVLYLAVLGAPAVWKLLCMTWSLCLRPCNSSSILIACGQIFICFTNISFFFIVPWFKGAGLKIGTMNLSGVMSSYLAL